MNPLIDLFLAEGCGRCPLGGTPACKVHGWTAELAAVRVILLGAGLTEELKWSAPCYTDQGRNIALLSALRDCVVLSFPNGSLLPDPTGRLELAGPNSRVGRVLRLRSLPEIDGLRQDILAWVGAAVEAARAGLKPPPSTSADLELPAEIVERLDEDPVLAAAFFALTLGRQRSYAIHVGGAVQSATRRSRFEKCIPKVMEGKGFHDR